MIRAALLALLLVACTPQAPQQVAAQMGDAVQDAAADAGGVVTDAVGDAGNGLAAAATPIALAIADAVTVVQPLPPVEPPPPAPADPAIALISKWEISSEANYERRLKAVYCPKSNGPSGPTGGIGYDFGQQTRTEIRRVWAWHPDVETLVTASGQVGPAACKAWRAQHRVVIELEDAKRVFGADSLPKYRRMAERALPGLANQSPGHNSGLTSLGYRRGWSMEGERMREKRVIRADCVPANNPACSAAQVIAMCRIWVGRSDYKGQCNRSHDEARVIRS